MADRVPFDRCLATGSSHVIAKKTRPRSEKLSRPPHPPAAAAADGRYAGSALDEIGSRGMNGGGCGCWAQNVADTFVGLVDP